VLKPLKPLKPLYGMTAAPPRLTSALLRLQIKLTTASSVSRASFEAVMVMPNRRASRVHDWRPPLSKECTSWRAQLESARQQSSRWKSSAELHRIARSRSARNGRARSGEPVWACARQRAALSIPWMGPGLGTGLGGPT
jgi:hypothetical protein